MLPAIVRSARELTSANVWVESCESIGMLGGSLVATALLALQGPALVLAGGAVLSLVSTLITLLAEQQRITAGEPRRDVQRSVGPVRLLLRQRGALRVQGWSRRRARHGVRPVHPGRSDRPHRGRARRRRASVSAIRVRAACRRAWASAHSMCAFVVDRSGAPRPPVAAVDRSRRSPSRSRAWFSEWLPALATALILLPVVGFGGSLLNLTSRMLLQRATPPDATAGVFAAIELFMGVGMVAGSIVAQVLIAAGGVDTALIGLGILFAILLVLTWRSLAHADDSADIPVVAISLLRRIPAFTPLPPLALEAVARAATEVSVTTGEVVMSEGEAWRHLLRGRRRIVRHRLPRRTASTTAERGLVSARSHCSPTCRGPRPSPRTARARCLPSTGSVPDRRHRPDSSRQAAWGVIDPCSSTSGAEIADRRRVSDDALRLDSDRATGDLIAGCAAQGVPAGRRRSC